MAETKYIFVTGGVLSGVGKGITAASIGAVLKAQGLKVSIQKCDPYLNVDAGLLNPAEHGECFVTKDGAETDLDLGHYERFLDIELTQKNATLSGRLLRQLIDDERAGKFGGKTVQLVPHLTQSIQAAIEEAGEGSDVHIVEIGGTVGDYEGLSFVEAIREFALTAGRANCMYVHVVYVPFIGTSKEFKSKPAQNALNDLRGFGIVPDAVIVRTDQPAPESIARKIALFGGVSDQSVLMMPNVDSVFRIPSIVAESGLMARLNAFTGLSQVPDLAEWNELIKKQQSGKALSQNTWTTKKPTSRCSKRSRRPHGRKKSISRSFGSMLRKHPNLSSRPLTDCWYRVGSGSAEPKVRLLPLPTPSSTTRRTSASVSVFRLP